MVLSPLGVTAPGSEQNPEPPQELAPAPAEAQAASFQPELAQPIPGAGADQSGRAVMPPALLGPEQVVLTALIHSPELEEPPAAFPDLEVDQGPALAPGVSEGPEPPPVTTEQTASAPEQQLGLAGAPKHPSPSLSLSSF